MNVAIVHYHLNHGGVTQVIANQLRALDCTCARDDHAAHRACSAAARRKGGRRTWGSSLHASDVVMGVAPRLQYDTATRG